MKKISTLILAAGLGALGACSGGGEVNNVTITNTGDELYNISADDLGGNYVNESYANDLGGNVSNAASNASNSVSNASNAVGNAAGNAL